MATIMIKFSREQKLQRIKESLDEGHYSEKSIQLVFKQAIPKAGIKQPATLNWLRHSYANHLLESETDLRYIRELLGHNRSLTTEIYSPVSNRNLQQILSPFDDL